MVKTFGYIVVFDLTKVTWKKIEIKERFSFMGYTLMVHKDFTDNRFWSVSEVLSGAVVSKVSASEKPHHKTAKAAIKVAESNIANYIKQGKDFEALIKVFRDKINTEKINIIELKKLRLL